MRGVMGLDVEPGLEGGFCRGGGLGRREEGEERISRLVRGGRGEERRARRWGRVGGVKVVRFWRRLVTVGAGDDGCDGACDGASEADLAREAARTASSRGPGRGCPASGDVSLISKWDGDGA